MKKKNKQKMKSECVILSKKEKKLRKNNEKSVHRVYLVECIFYQIIEHKFKRALQFFHKSKANNTQNQIILLDETVLMVFYALEN